MKHLKQKVKEENDYKIKEKISLIEERGLNDSLSWYNKKYKGTEEQQKKKLIRYITLKNNKRLKEQLDKIERVSNAPDFEEDLYITVDWKKSRMWGNNPKATVNNGIESERISGCGYDKESTATAQVFNQCLSILKLLYTKKEKYLSSVLYKTLKEKPEDTTINRKLLGYGSGYGVLPYFEGGVGISSHINVFENVGLKMRIVSSTKTTDTYKISLIKEVQK